MKSKKNIMDSLEEDTLNLNNLNIELFTFRSTAVYEFHGINAFFQQIHVFRRGISGNKGLSLHRGLDVI